MLPKLCTLSPLYIIHCIGTIGKCTSRTASAAAGTIAGMATVIVVLVLIIVVLSGAIIAGAIWYVYSQPS